MDDEPLTRPVSHRTAYDAVHETPSQIEREIAATRAELGEIFGALERRLAPRQLLESGVDILKDEIVAKSSRFKQSLRGQPLPLPLVGLYVGWLLISQRPRPRPPQAAHKADERARERAGKARETVPDNTSGIADAAEYAHAWEKSGKATDQPWVVTPKGARSALSRQGGRVSGLIDQRPLALGVLGLLAGATVALMVPRSASEERLIGPVGERLREEAASLGREAVDRVQLVAEHTVDAAAEVVRRAIDGVGRA